MSLTAAPPEPLTAEAACEALRAAGLALSPSDVKLEQRDERWAVTLPGDRMAWFPAGDGGLRRLSLERRVLRLLAERCTFRTPTVLYEHPGGFDVRAIVPGSCDPWPLFHRAKHDTALARRLGRSIGAMLIEQHTRIQRKDVAGWLPDRLRWPETNRLGDGTDCDNRQRPRTCQGHWIDVRGLRTHDRRARGSRAGPWRSRFAQHHHVGR